MSKGKIDEKNAKYLTDCLIFDAPRSLNEVLDRKEELEELAKLIYGRDDIFYIGRGIDYQMSQEASLKLKEISYIHSQAYAAGELKHGTISLIEKGTPVIAIATQRELCDKIDSNIKEVRARGAKAILICSPEMENADVCADVVFKLPKSSPIGNIFSSLAATQLIAYEVARLRGCDIDKPKNLAKSVTVE
jgi:glucosamine--fructose-6-phosphate aminotransferase (isomerizing)